jgi:hypothetical protein
MNILFLSHYFPPEVNAPATRTYEHCKRWAAAGHNVTVITCAPNCPDGVVYAGYRNRFRREEIIDGIRVIRVWTYIAPNKGFFRRIMNYVSYMVSATFHAVVTLRDIDVVVATSPQFFCGWAGVLCRWLRRWPFILEIRDIWPESILTVGAMQKSLLIRFLERMERLMYRSSTHMVTVGEGYRRRIMEKDVPPDKISVVMNGVDLDSFQPVADTQFIRREFRSEGKFICAYIGTVGMAHGLEVVIEAARQCREAGKTDIMFWIVGDGARREELENQVNALNLDNIVFTGRLARERMPEVISACDACLVHLRGTALFGTVIPSKIFEFMAMDVPIIMGVRGQARNFVLEAGAGVAMTPDDPRSLIDGLEQIRERGRDAFTGREYVRRHFNRDVLAGEMLRIIVVSD